MRKFSLEIGTCEQFVYVTEYIAAFPQQKKKLLFEFSCKAIAIYSFVFS